MTIKTHQDYTNNPLLFKDLIKSKYFANEMPGMTDALASREDSLRSSEEKSAQEIRFVQMLVAAVKYAQEPAPITINNISSSQAEAASKTEATGSGQISSRSSLELISEMYHSFFSSRFNRVCFFGMCGMSMYVYWSYLDHKWHMAEVQRRIDSNLVLKMSQWLFSADQPQPTRFLPSLWS